MDYKYLGKLDTPEKISSLDNKSRVVLCEELRDKIINTVSTNGGHLASNLGAVELTVALLSVFDYTKDKIVFDVGHQAYSYKLLTGRFDRFDTLRQKGGISGFPRRSESPYDVFDTGHSSTSVSAAIGMARARDIAGEDHYVISVIGDGAMTGGLAYEAINDIGHNQSKMIIILNDNEMSIDRNVGGMSKYLKNLRISSGYLSAKKYTESFINTKLPVIGKPIVSMIMAIKKFFRFIVNRKLPSMFEDLGLRYYGPVDGHDLEGLIKALDAVKDLNVPVLLHIITKKGKGYRFAEEAPSDYHGVGPFDKEKGVAKGSKNSYTNAFSGALMQIATKNKKVIGISAAMAQGTGMDAFAYKFPNRFFDCGIAEEHAVTMAGGMAVSGFIPVVAIYSSFLQRAYDEMIHDVCFMNNHVVFAIDRSGFVGNDGHTHNGLLDISYLNTMPNMTILSPRDYVDLKRCLSYAVSGVEGPCAVRYPRGTSVFEEGGCLYEDEADVVKPHVISDAGNDFAIVSVGTICAEATKAFEKLSAQGVKGKNINLSLIRPIPVDDLAAILAGVRNVFTVEEGILSGGFGESFMEIAQERKLGFEVHPIAVTDQMIRAGSVKEQLEQAGLDCDSIVKAVADRIK